MNIHKEKQDLDGKRNKMMDNYSADLAKFTNISDSSIPAIST